MKSRKELLEEFKKNKILQNSSGLNNVKKPNLNKQKVAATPVKRRVGRVDEIVEKGNVGKVAGRVVKIAPVPAPVSVHQPTPTVTVTSDLNLRFELESKNQQLKDLEIINSDLISELERVKQELTEFLLKQEDLERLKEASVKDVNGKLSNYNA